MTSHVDQQVQAAIAAARNKRQQQRQQRAELDANRQAGVAARHRAKLKRIYCGQCARPQRRGTYQRCPLGCGTALCRKRASCGNSHLDQCPRRRGVPSIPGEDA
ncbi:hypothetical protein ABZX30_28780 [Streptomyces sp. NPDC004542]|uniref:hypothetical protein n=1 Tax=Streptomyces sp. NPDC004542 TaxID=3154281 RepID=UPI0033A579A0